jgi:hypothetical protein
MIITYRMSRSDAGGGIVGKSWTREIEELSRIWELDNEQTLALYERVAKEQARGVSEGAIGWRLLTLCEHFDEHRAGRSEEVSPEPEVEG